MVFKCVAGSLVEDITRRQRNNSGAGTNQSPIPVSILNWRQEMNDVIHRWRDEPVVPVYEPLSKFITTDLGERFCDVLLINQQIVQHSTNFCDMCNERDRLSTLSTVVHVWNLSNM
jgi:hypothetical protein